jgi:hypothetical protein
VTGPRHWLHWAPLPILAIIALTTLPATPTEAPAPGAVDVHLLRARMASVLGREPSAPVAIDAAARRNRNIRRLRALIRSGDRRFSRDGRALVRVLSTADADGSRIAAAATRLRADVRLLRARVRGAKARTRAGRRAQTLVLGTLASSLTGLSAIRRFARATDSGAALSALASADRALARAEILARRARARLGCRRTCGSGF